MIDLTEEQRLIVESDIAPGETKKIIAGAGSGKTTVLDAYARYREDKGFLYVAFNKSVQQEAERRFPGNTQSKTMHSIAYAEFREQFARSGRNPSSSVGYKPIRIQFRVSIAVAALIRETLNNFLVSADTEILPFHAARKEDVRIPSNNPTEFLVDAAKKLWVLMKSGSSKFIPMTHDGYLKMFQLMKPRLSGDIILYDEAQDTNPVCTDIVLNQLNFGKGVMFCGDPFQQIYSWRGAVDALQNIQADPMYLTQSFRFSNNVASYANALLEMYFHPDFKLSGCSGKPDIVRGHTKIEEGVTDTGMLFRTNAKMFEKMFELAKDNVMFYYCGDLAALLDFVMDIYFLKMGMRHMMSEGSRAKSFDNYDELTQVAKIDAELSSIRKIIEEHQGKLPEIVDAIRQNQVSFANHADVSVSTIHKAKGLEWKNVIVSNDITEMMLNGKMLPLVPDAPSHVQDVLRNPEDINLLYVAMTRAKETLELPSTCLGMRKCFEENQATGKFFHAPDFRKKSFDREFDRYGEERRY